MLFFLFLALSTDINLGFTCFFFCNYYLLPIYHYNLQMPWMWVIACDPIVMLRLSLWIVKEEFLHLFLFPCNYFVYFRHYQRPPAIYIYAGPMLSSGPPTGSSVALWKDPLVWLCGGIAMTVLVVQGMRVGLVDKLRYRWQHQSWHWWLPFVRR